jgi:hypothetical protein
MSAKKKKPSGNWSWDARAESQASFQREVESRRRDPFRSLQEALDFTENLLAVAVQCIGENDAALKLAAKMDDSAEVQIHAGERTFWTGVKQACIAITKGTTIPR